MRIELIYTFISLSLYRTCKTGVVLDSTVARTKQRIFFDTVLSTIAQYQLRHVNAYINSTCSTCVNHFNLGFLHQFFKVRMTGFKKNIIK